MFSWLKRKETKEVEKPKKIILKEDQQLLLAQLNYIRETALDKKNTYLLDKKDKKNLTITLDTLEFLVRNLDNPVYRFSSRRDTCYQSSAPIHFDTYPIVNYKAADRRAFLITNYIEHFIEGFNNVLEATPIRHRNLVKIFCSRLYGNCIEMRTRKAFTFGDKMKSEPPKWEALYADAKFCLENNPFNDSKNTLNATNTPATDESQKSEPLSPQEIYELYLSTPETQNALIDMVTRFFSDDFDLKIANNRKIAQQVIKHLCHINPESAGMILYNNIHKKNKEILIDWLIENDANLNHEENVDNKIINTLHRAICHGASNRIISNLIDYGAVIHPDMTHETLTAALKYCDVSCMQTLLIEYPALASSLHTHLDSHKFRRLESNEEKNPAAQEEQVAVMTDQKNVLDTVQYKSAKLKLLQAMLMAQGEGSEFAYSKAEKNFYQTHLTGLLQVCTTIAGCFQLFSANEKNQILKYERIINRSTLTFNPKDALTASVQAFIKATQERIYQLLSSEDAKKHPILHYYELLAAIHHPLFSLPMYTPKDYEQKLLALYTEAKQQLFLENNKGEIQYTQNFTPKNAVKFLTNRYVLEGLHKEKHLPQVFKYIHANIEKHPDAMLAPIFRCMRETGLFNNESILNLEKSFNEARKSKSQTLSTNSAPKAPNNPIFHGKSSQNGVSVAPPVTQKKLASDPFALDILPVAPKPISRPTVTAEGYKIDQHGRIVKPISEQTTPPAHQPNIKPITKVVPKTTISSDIKIKSLLDVNFDIEENGNVKVNVKLNPQSATIPAVAPSSNNTLANNSSTAIIQNINTELPTNLAIPPIWATHYSTPNTSPSNEIDFFSLEFESLSIAAPRKAPAFKKTG